MSNYDKLDAVKNIRYEPYCGGEPYIMTKQEAEDHFGCLVEVLQGYHADGAVFAMDKNNHDIFIEWE